MTTTTAKKPRDGSLSPTAERVEAAPRVVYTSAPLSLGRLLRESDAGWVLSTAGEEREVPAHETVDPALLREALETQAPVLLDSSGSPVIVGVIATRRTLTVDGEGRVEAKVKSLRIDAAEEVLLSTPGAYLRAKNRAVEVYGNRVLTRARDVVKILSAMIKLN